MKRFLDVVISLSALIALAPVLAAAVLAVRLSGAGPVFFTQERVGRFGRPFRIIKLRTMTSASRRRGRLITVSGDRRITPVGRFLRRWKLDELPQLINVLRGEMSIVGPRPEVEEYVSRFLDEYGPLLSLRPGLTHRASIVFRNEEELLARATDPERFYVERVMPRKLEIYHAELDHDSLANDLRTIVDTVRAVALGNNPTGSPFTGGPEDAPAESPMDGMRRAPARPAARRAAAAESTVASGTN